MAGFIMYGLLYIILQMLLKIGWWRWRIEGVENLPPRKIGGIILAMNHIHWLDILAVGTMLPFSYRLSWLGKVELFAHPILRWYFTSMQVVPVNRGKRDLNALYASEEALKRGAALLIFPEGHRSGTGVLQPGRGGTIRLAARARVPIVPLAIIGTQYGLKGTLLRREVVLRIGKPYMVGLPANGNGKIPPDIMESTTADLMYRIAELLPAQYRGVYREELSGVGVTTKTRRHGGTHGERRLTRSCSDGGSRTAGPRAELSDAATGRSA